jgi:hypothetical protein
MEREKCVRVARRKVGRVYAGLAGVEKPDSQVEHIQTLIALHWDSV